MIVFKIADSKMIHHARHTVYHLFKQFVHLPHFLPAFALGSYLGNITQEYHGISRLLCAAAHDAISHPALLPVYIYAAVKQYFAVAFKQHLGNTLHVVKAHHRRLMLLTHICIYKRIYKPVPGLIPIEYSHE